MPETYAASMDPATDWGVGNAMNEFRNRRTDVTPQFLYQYGLHFKLPADWNPPQARRHAGWPGCSCSLHSTNHSHCSATQQSPSCRLSHCRNITMDESLNIFLLFLHRLLPTPTVSLPPPLPVTAPHKQEEERLRRFRSYLWLGHMQHARCYETSLNFWRRLRSHPECVSTPRHDVPASLPDCCCTSCE